MLKLTGSEKAVIGGVTSALFTIIVQLSDKPSLTLRDVEVALAAYVATHLTVWVTTNTPKVETPVVPPVTPTIITPDVTPTA